MTDLACGHIAYMCLAVVTMKIQIILATYVIILTRLVTQGSSSLSVGSSKIVSTPDWIEPTRELNIDDDEGSSRLQKRGVLATPYTPFGYPALSVHPPSRFFVTYPPFVPLRFPIRPIFPFPNYFGYPLRYPALNLEPPIVPTPGITLVPPLPPGPIYRLLR